MSDRDKLSKHIDSTFADLKRHILYFYDKDPQYGTDLTKWFLEVGIKNKVIHTFKEDETKADKEMARRRRTEVYWMDFGINIGSEFNYPHFCVVVKEFTYHAIVIPISSVKEEDKSWKSEDNLFIEIGKIDGLPDKTPDSYAVVSQMKAVSKQRLSSFKHKGNFLKLKLSADQMDQIDTAIASFPTKK